MCSKGREFSSILPVGHYRPFVPAAQRPVSYSGLEIATADEDWFRVEANGSTVTAKIDFSHATGDLDLALSDESGSSLDSSTSTSDSEEVSGSDDVVLIRGYGCSGTTGGYELTVTVD